MVEIRREERKVYAGVEQMANFFLCPQVVGYKMPGLESAKLTEADRDNGKGKRWVRGWRYG